MWMAARRDEGDLSFCAYTWRRKGMTMTVANAVAYCSKTIWNSTNGRAGHRTEAAAMCCNAKIWERNCTSFWAGDTTRCGWRR